VLLDSGNFADNPTQAGDTRTAALLEGMAKLGYKAVNVGDRDLALGYDDFVQRTRGLGMPFISTNIVKQGTKTTVFPPYVIVEATGAGGKPLRIGVMGVIRYSPVWQKAGPAGENLGVAMPEEMVRFVLSEVRQKSDVVVLLAALSKEDAREIAKSLQDIDLILGSYGGIYSTQEEQEGRVRIVYTGNQGKRIGESRVTLDAKGKFDGAVSYIHFLTARYPEDKATAAAVAAVNAKLGKAPDPKPQFAPAAAGP
jgi:2',3'-cyclic-nucleotide 2'-phosphodiesterase (5'-nucleotidase family)